MYGKKYVEVTHVHILLAIQFILYDKEVVSKPPDIDIYLHEVKVHHPEETQTNPQREHAEKEGVGPKATSCLLWVKTQTRLSSV